MKREKKFPKSIKLLREKKDCQIGRDKKYSVKLLSLNWIEFALNYGKND